MKSTLVLTALVCAVATASSASADPEVEELKNGIYRQQLKISTIGAPIVYYADTEGRVCFMGNTGSPMPVPCEDLARRKGWAEVITWVPRQPESD